MAFQSFSATGQQGGGFDQAMAGLVNQDQFNSQNAMQGGGLQLNQQQMQLQREQMQTEAQQAQQLAMLRLLQGREEMQGQLGLEAIRSQNDMAGRKFTADQNLQLETSRQAFEGAESSKRYANDARQDQMRIAAAESAAAKSAQLQLRMQAIETARETAVAKGDVEAEKIYGPQILALQQELANHTIAQTVLGARVQFTERSLKDFLTRMGQEFTRQRGILSKRDQDGTTSAAEVFADFSSQSKSALTQRMRQLMGLPDLGNSPLYEGFPTVAGFDGIDTMPSGLQYLKFDQMDEFGRPQVSNFDKLLMSSEEIRASAVAQVADSVAKAMVRMSGNKVDPTAAREAIVSILESTDGNGIEQKAAAVGVDPVMLKGLFRELSKQVGSSAAKTREAYASAKMEDVQNRAGLGHAIFPGIFSGDQKSLRTIGLGQQVIADNVLTEVLARASAGIRTTTVDELSALESRISAYAANEDIAGLASTREDVYRMTDSDSDFDTTIGSLRAPVMMGETALVPEVHSGTDLRGLLAERTGRRTKIEEDKRALDARKAAHALGTRVGVSEGVDKDILELLRLQQQQVDSAEAAKRNAMP